MPRCRRRANKTVKMRARALLSAKRSPARNWLAAVGFCTWRWKHKICLQFEWLKIEVQKSLKNIKCVLGQNWLTFVLSRKWWFERCISFSTRVSQTYNCKYCRNAQLWHCTGVKTIIVQVENTLIRWPTITKDSILCVLKLVRENTSTLSWGEKWCLKMGQPRPLFRLLLVFSNKHHYNFFNKCMWKNVHPVYGTGIRTHNLWNVILFQ